MKVSAMICLIPLGAGLSLSKYVASCERVFRESGLEPRLHAHGTNVEGDWHVVMAALRRCHEEVHAAGAPRIATFVKLGTRTDREPSLDRAVESVERELRG